MNNHIFRAMGSEICLQALTIEQNKDTQSLFEFVQTLLSRFDANSDVCFLNAHKNSWHSVHPITFAVLKDAYMAFTDTKGLFNPFIGNIIADLGYDKSFELLNQASNILSSVTTLAGSASLQPELEFNENNIAIRINNHTHIDLGGYAKGWCAQLAFQQLWIGGVRQGLIDAGGDIICWGPDCEIAISDPFDDNNIIATISINGVLCIATSNILYRRWFYVDDTIAHHIIDPRNNKVASTDLLQVSVVADNLAKAEQLTKCILVLGSIEAISWMQQYYPELGYVLVKNNKEIISKNLTLAY